MVSMPPAWTAAAEVAAGNGGTAGSTANGGAVAAGEVSSGRNVDHRIGVGDTQGDVSVSGGGVANSTTLDLSSDGGSAISDASGGDENVAFQIEEAGARPRRPEASPAPEPTPSLVSPPQSAWILEQPARPVAAPADSALAAARESREHPASAVTLVLVAFRQGALRDVESWRLLFAGLHSGHRLPLTGPYSKLIDQSGHRCPLRDP